MARKYDITNIIDPVKAPFTKRSLTHLNTAFDDLTAQMIESNLTEAYTTNDVIILSGCDVTANIPGTSEVTAGQIYYNGRIYDVDANASITSPADTLVWNIVESYISGDPATFSDGNSYNFHIIEKFVLSNAVTGSGIADYNGATVKYKIRYKRFNIGSWNMDSSLSVGINTGLDSAIFTNKLLSVDMQVLDDTLVYAGPFIGVSGNVELWWTYSVGGGQIIINLYRLTSGQFDNTSYNDTLINSGYFYLKYGNI